MDNSPGTGPHNLTMIALWSETFQNIRKLKNGNIAIKIMCFASYLSTPCLTPAILTSLLPKVEYDGFEQALDLLENYFVIEKSNNSLAIHSIIRDIAKDTLKLKSMQRNLLFQETFLNHAALLVELCTGLVQYLESRLKLGEINAEENNHLADNIFALTSHLTELDLMPTKELEKAVYLLDLLCSIRKSYALNMDYNKIIDLYGALLKGADSQRGPEQTRLLTLKRKIGDVLMKQEKYAAAKEMYIKVFTAYKKLLGRDHEDTLTTQACIADALNSLGDYAGALKMFIAILIKQKERVDLPCDQVELTLKFKVATLLCEHGEYVDALKLLERVPKDSKEMYGHGPGADNLFQLQAQTWIARVLVKQEKYDEAIELYMTLMDASKNLQGPHHTDTLLLKCDYAPALSCKGSDHETAKDILQRTLKYQKQNMGYTMLELAETENNLAQVLLNLNDTKSAILMYAHVLQVRSDHLGPEHPLTLNTEQAWAYALYCEQKFHKSAKVFRKVLSGQKKALGKYHPDTMLTLQYLSQSLFEQEEFKMSVRFAEYLHELKVRKNFSAAGHPKLVRNQQLLDLSIAKLPKSVRGVSKFPKPTPPPLLDLPAWIFVEAGHISNIPCMNPRVRGPDNGNLDGKTLFCWTYKKWTQTIAAIQIIICGLSFILNVFDLLPEVPTVYFIISLSSGSLLTLPGRDMQPMMSAERFEHFDKDVYQICSKLRHFSSYRLTLVAISFVCAVYGSILYAGAHHKKQALLLFWMMVKGLEIGIFGITLMYLVYPIFHGNLLACVLFLVFLVCEVQNTVSLVIVFRHRQEFKEHLARMREELLPVEFGFVNIA